MQLPRLASSRQVFQKAAVTLKDRALSNGEKIRTDVAGDSYIAPQEDAFTGPDIEGARAVDDCRAHVDVGVDASRSRHQGAAFRSNASREKPLNVQDTLKPDLAIRSKVALDIEVYRVVIH